MHLFEILVLLAFCFVFAKAGEEDLFDKLSDEIGITDDEVTVENLYDGTDMAAETDSLESDGQNVRRQSIRPSILRRVTVLIAVPGNVNSASFKICYCYRRLCYG